MPFLWCKRRTAAAGGVRHSTVDSSIESCILESRLLTICLVMVYAAFEGSHFAAELLSVRRKHH
jgi:hypothetical protein